MDRWDWMFAIGILACAIGAGWWLHPAAGLIIIGAALVYGGWRAAPLGRLPRPGPGG